MSSWIAATIVVLVGFMVSCLLGATPWSAYQVFTATALLAIFLKLKD